MIIDDSILPKTGKTIELLSKVYDHGAHLYKLGMKILSLGYNDGKSFTPLDFSLHLEPGKSGKRSLKAKDFNRQFSKERLQDTPGYEREKEIGESKIDIAISMILRFVKRKIKVDYILADSWFITEGFIKSILTFDKSVNIIGLLKVNRIVIIDGKKINVNKVADVYRK